jgi:rubrerythrin
MRNRIQAILRQIAAEPALEARWLNTLSLLEFIGARKISRTIADRHPSLEVLGHLADETRHAMAFKRLACEVAGRDVSEYLCAQEATAWFQMLDRELAAWATQALGRADVRLNYLLTTTLVEQRAMLLYPLYKAATRQASVRAELGKIVTEEQSHRRDIEETCQRLLKDAGVPDFSEPKAIEERLFGKLLAALERESTGDRDSLPPYRA